jgi:hypothetical protein
MFMNTDPQTPIASSNGLAAVLASAILLAVFGLSLAALAIWAMISTARPDPAATTPIGLACLISFLSASLAVNSWRALRSQNNRLVAIEAELTRLKVP